MQNLAKLNPSQFVLVKNVKIETVQSFLNRQGVIQVLPTKVKQKRKSRKAYYK